MTNETKPTAKRKQPTIMIRPSQVREALATGDIAALIRLAIVFLAAVAALYAGGSVIVDPPADPPAIVEPAE